MSEEPTDQTAEIEETEATEEEAVESETNDDADAAAVDDAPRVFTDPDSVEA